MKGRAVSLVRRQLHAHRCARMADEADERTVQRCLLVLLIGLRGFRAIGVVTIRMAIDTHAAYIVAWQRKQ